jgi:type III restriction enzyme
VRFWLRNVALLPVSFRLPTSTDFFYPDFVAQLNDGRTLVVEYKGEDRATNDDSKEKAVIGEIWAKLSGGKGLFLLAVKSQDGKSVAEQIKDKIG